MKSKKYKVGQLVYIDFPNNSFKWANGLKIIVAVNKETIDLVNLDTRGNLSMFNDGRYMTSTTGINNSGITIIKGFNYKVNSNLL